jgi:membrane fusion protein, multidrug efflux system
MSLTMSRIGNLISQIHSMIRRGAKQLSFAAVLLVLLGGIGYFLYDQYKYESTDDAYVSAYATQISPKVSGIVTHVLVQENQKVIAGQILVQIDRKDYDAALSDAVASLGALAAQLKSAELDFKRSALLLKSQAVSQQSFDRAQAGFLDLDRRTKAAEARVEEARLNLEYSSVRAPSDGVIARRSVDIGTYIPVGTAVLGFVPSNERWVDANFKETQLSSIVPGRPARVTVDAIPGKTYDAIIESISPATGATFTLLPPDNATGNFTKVTQRVPVRIRLKGLTSRDIELLQAGLSTVVDVLKHEEPQAVPALAAPVFAASQIVTAGPPYTGEAGTRGR